MDPSACRSRLSSATSLFNGQWRLERSFPLYPFSYPNSLSLPPVDYPYDTILDLFTHAALPDTNFFCT